MSNNNSVSLHRVIKTTPEKLFRAFSNADALTSWLPPYGFTAKMHSMEFKVGSGYKMSFTNFTTGASHSFSGTYVDIQENKSLKYIDKFDSPGLPGEMPTTVNIRKVMGGTELKITQENIPEIIPADMCYLGWQDSLDKLIRLVEPEIPDA